MIELNDVRVGVVGLGYVGLPLAVAFGRRFPTVGFDISAERIAELDEALRPIRERYHELMADPAELDRILAIGAERARAVAEPKIEEVKRKVGFIIP